VDSSERRGRYRWTVERANAWRLAFRRLTVRSERHAASVLAFLPLACALIRLRFRQRAEATCYHPLRAAPIASGGGPGRASRARGGPLRLLPRPVTRCTEATGSQGRSSVMPSGSITDSI
jgi:hypothetical protein